jgi:protein-S-isoprenylcysteine O-methyltransferase Ste14
MSSLHSALDFLVGACLVVFVVAWVAGALYFGARSQAGPLGWARGLRRTGPRTALLVAGAYGFSLLLSNTGDFWRHLRYWQPELAVLGVLLALASTALLLWSRWVLGAMWDGVPTVKEHHELRTDGPYRLVRHPIYTGILGLVTGAMLAFGFGAWTAVVAVCIPWLLRRVHVEDALMAAEFGPAYATYRARTPALLPGLHLTTTAGRHLGDAPR